VDEKQTDRNTQEMGFLDSTARFKEKIPAQLQIKTDQQLTPSEPPKSDQPMAADVANPANQSLQTS